MKILVPRKFRPLFYSIVTHARITNENFECWVVIGGHSPIVSPSAPKFHEKEKIKTLQISNKMSKLTLIILTVISYSISFFCLTDKVFKISELREEIDLGLQAYANRWPVEKGW